MRLILDHLVATNPAHIRVVEELQKNHEIAYWIRLNEVPIDPLRFPRTVFHDANEAVQNIPPREYRDAPFAPLSAHEIARYARWEMEILVMMEKYFPHASVSQRYDRYYELLRYWTGVFDRVQPEGVIFNGPPHHVYNHVIFAIAKERGVKTLMFDVTCRLDRILIQEDYRDGHPLLAGVHERGTLTELPEYLQEHYTENANRTRPPERHFTYFKKEHSRIKEIMRRVRALGPFIKDGTVFERAVSRFFKLIRADAQDEYERLQRTPDFSVPYVYVPLHYQPECTTSPQGGVFVDQLLTVRMLASALPPGWLLYVKEHPAQWPAHIRDYTPQRYRGFYSELAAIPQVTIVPVGTNTFDLADKARATATATGTAGWESVLRGTPVLVFGYPWYMHAPGVYRVSSVAECRDALTAIARGVSSDRELLFGYLKTLDAATFWGYLDFVGDRSKHFDTEREWQDMFQAIETGLNRI